METKTCRACGVEIPLMTHHVCVGQVTRQGINPPLTPKPVTFSDEPYAGESPDEVVEQTPWERAAVRTQALRDEAVDRAGATTHSFYCHRCEEQVPIGVVHTCTKDKTVDHPDHYGGKDNPYEVIKVLEAWLTPEEFRGFLKGNIHKYLARDGKKGAPVRDQAKAAWYAEYLDEYNKRVGQRI